MATFKNQYGEEFLVDDERVEWANAVARQLGAEQAIFRYHDNCCSIALSDGAAISLYFDGYRNKVNVGGEWPEYTELNGNKERIYMRAPDVSVGIKRDPVAAAKDIARRFIPEYLKLYAEAKQFAADRQAAANSRSATLEVIAKALGAKPYHDARTWSYSLDIDAQVIHDSQVDLKVRCSPELALRIIELVKAEKEPRS